MANLYVATDKYAEKEGQAIVAAFHTSIKQMVSDRLEKSGSIWSDFVFGSSLDLIGKSDFEALEAGIIASGYRFAGSAMISVPEQPDVYKPIAGANVDSKEFSFEHPEANTAPADATGRERSGQGNNVLRTAHNIIGTARYVRSGDQDLRCISEGLRENTIAIIDDSGGTLTAQPGNVCRRHLRRRHCAFPS